MYPYASCKDDAAFEQLCRGLFYPPLANKIDYAFYDYYGRFVTNRESLCYFFSVQRRLSEVLRSKGRDVLEIGCGFGLILICQTLLGAKRAIGIDISDEMISGFKVLLTRFPELAITPLKGDFLVTEFEKESFDVVILNETISHVRDTRLLLDKIQRTLRPQGVLFIADGNNDAFFPSRIQRRRGWITSERGPIPERQAQYGRAVDRLSFFDARKEIIKTAFPLLDDDSVKLLAQRTQGMYGQNLEQACRELLSTGKTHQRASFPYRNPYTGEFPELGINPFRLTKDLEARGFQCRYLPPPYSYLGWHTKLSFAKDLAVKGSRLIFKCPNKLFPLFSPYFLIMATRCQS